MKGTLAVAYRSLDPEGSIAGVVSLVEPFQVAADVSDRQVEEELHRALRVDDDAVQSILVTTDEITRRREAREPHVPALDVPLVEEVLRVTLEAVKDEAPQAVTGAILAELVNQALAAIKGRRRPSRRDQFPVGSLFQVAPGVLDEASRLLDVPPGALAPERAEGNTHRVDIHARLMVGAGGDWHVWGTKDGEVGARRISASEWRSVFEP